MIKRFLKYSVLFALIGMAVTGCSKSDDDSSSVTSPAQIEVISVVKPSSSPTSIIATIRNAGEVTAYDLASVVKVYSNQQLIAEVNADIEGLTGSNDLPADQDAVMTANLSVPSHDDYTDLVFDFTWREQRSQTGATLQTTWVPVQVIELDL